MLLETLKYGKGLSNVLVTQRKTIPNGYLTYTEDTSDVHRSCVQPVNIIVEKFTYGDLQVCQLSLN